MMYISLSTVLKYNLGVLVHCLTPTLSATIYFHSTTFWSQILCFKSLQLFDNFVFQLICLFADLIKTSLVFVLFFFKKVNFSDFSEVLLCIYIHQYIYTKYFHPSHTYVTKTATAQNNWTHNCNILKKYKNVIHISNMIVCEMLTMFYQRLLM